MPGRPQGHTVRPRVERQRRERERGKERVRENGSEALPFLGSKGKCSNVLRVYSLLANLKQKSRNQGAGGKKWGHPSS